MKQITIITPIYNGEKYLARAIESVISQSIFDKIKLLLLDDGSTDSSLSIAQSYSTNYDFIETLTHQNMGTAKTRNKGISLVDTKWTMFLDQDDFLNEECCESLLDEAEKTYSDVVACGIARHNGEKMLYERVATDTAWYRYIHVEAWGKIHRTDFIKQNGAKFFDNIFGEDIPFAINENINAKKYSVIPYVGYNWFHNESSVTQTVHKQFNNINLVSLLDEVNKFNKSDVSEYYMLTIAVYALLHSNTHATKIEFINNITQTFSHLEQLDSILFQNVYISKRIDGITLTSYYATRLITNAYISGKFSKLWFVYNLMKPILKKK